jgi:hypothetical protein
MPAWVAFNAIACPCSIKFRQLDCIGRRIRQTGGGTAADIEVIAPMVVHEADQGSLRLRTKTLWPELTNWPPGTHKGRNQNGPVVQAAEICQIRVPDVDRPFAGDHGKQMIPDTCRWLLFRAGNGPISCTKNPVRLGKCADTALLGFSDRLLVPAPSPYAYQEASWLVPALCRSPAAACPGHRCGHSGSPASGSRS